MIDLYTSFWANPELSDLDATLVGISRGVPRASPGYRYKLARWLAPSDEAWHAPDEEGYEAAYLRQLEEIGAPSILGAVERIGAGKPAILVCFEKPGEWCHRRLLADYIEQEIGETVPELEPGDLPRRKDVPQLTLFDQLPREERRT